ncbi:MAG: winged helix-turn-helix transcriptional regulator, partial [Aeriscardovia sp.]|nr:winged helix-turn-helix transcriptional regulator [Aeriscardovia sp.]
GVDEDEKASVEIASGPFVLNTRNRTLEKNGSRLKLTQIEYLLMKLFMENPGKAMSREDILSAVWGSDFSGELKTVDVNIRRLRIKIESDPTEPEFLTTVWGYGYKWGY